MITVVNYGLGNIQALVNIYRRLNIPVSTAGTVKELLEARRIILPGVGAFDWAMRRLEQSGMRPCLDDLVLQDEVPVLGICVGMQMLLRGSEEGELPGLGWIDGRVRRFDEATVAQGLMMPHMGWNEAVPVGPTHLWRGMEAGERFYFLHSYYAAPEKPQDVLATTDYGGRFASAIHSQNVWGVQFHPEKSHLAGVRLLKNFAEA